VPSFLKADTSESNCWHSVFRSVKEVLITSCDFGYMKVCARWVSWSLTVEYKTQRNAISSVFLSHVEAEEEASLSLIVTISETLVLTRDKKPVHGMAPYSIAWWRGN